MNVKEIEALGVSCREIEDCPMYNVGKFARGTYDGKSPANKLAALHDDKFGIQQMMDKFRKIYGWRVAKNEWHPDTKSFDVTIMENSKVKEVRHISYEEICETMWWHSFDIVSGDTIKPNKFMFEEREAIEMPKVEATNKKIKKWLKEHPEEAAKIAAEKEAAENA